MATHFQARAPPIILYRATARKPRCGLSLADLEGELQLSRPRREQAQARASPPPPRERARLHRARVREPEQAQDPDPRQRSSGSSQSSDKKQGNIGFNSLLLTINVWEISDVYLDRSGGSALVLTDAKLKEKQFSRVVVMMRVQAQRLRDELLLKYLGKHNEVLVVVYMVSTDVSFSVNQAVVHVWKAIVANTPKTLKEIKPVL